MNELAVHENLNCLLGGSGLESRVAHFDPLLGPLGAHQTCTRSRSRPSPDAPGVRCPYQDILWVLWSLLEFVEALREGMSSSTASHFKTANDAPGSCFADSTRYARIWAGRGKIEAEARANEVRSKAIRSLADPSGPGQAYRASFTVHPRPTFEEANYSSLW